MIDGNGFKPDPALTEAIRNFRRPANISDIRAFFGLAEEVGNFSDHLAQALLPLSPLLKKDYQWEWTETHERAFRAARVALSTVSSLSFYDPKRPTALHVDASRLNGLGFVLKQQQPNGIWQMVQPALDSSQTLKSATQ